MKAVGVWIHIVYFVFIFSNFLFGQDTLKTYNKADIEVVKKYDGKGKIKYEKHYFRKEKVAHKKWYYRKNYFEIIEYPDFKNRPSFSIQTTYYNNGKLRSRATQSRGKYHGVYESFYNNGKEHCQCNFEYGKRQGHQKMFYDNGQNRFEAIYNSDEIWTVISYYKYNGNILNPGTLKEGTGYVNAYDFQGILIKKFYYGNGKLKNVENVLSDGSLVPQKKWNPYDEDF